MLLNRELFWRLCKQYKVPVSSEYDTVMLEEEDGTIHELTDDDIERILSFGSFHS